MGDKGKKDKAKREAKKKRQLSIKVLKHLLNLT